MMECVFCKKTRYLFSFAVTGDNEVYTQHVCGKCWEAIAEIAHRRINNEIENLAARIKALEAHGKSAGTYTLNIGCHRGTITSRDSETREFATYADAHANYLEAKRAWARFGYVVWFAEITAPDGTKTHLESNSNYR